MRVIAPVGPILGESIAAKLKSLFFGLFTRHKAKPSEQAIRVPRQRYDAVCVLFWCVLVPLVCGWFWYAVYGLIRALVVRL